MNPNTIQKLQNAIQFFQQGSLAEADKILSQVLIQNSNNFDALFIKGVICGIQSKHSDCKNYLLKAERINPNHAFVQFNLAKSMSELGEDKQAIPYHQKAVYLAPQNKDAWINYGKCLFSLARYSDALLCFIKADQLQPNDHETLFNIGNTLQELGQLDNALTFFDKALSIKPDYDYFIGARFHLKMNMCYWDNLQQDINQIISAIGNNEKVSTCFPLLAITDSMAIQRKVAEIWVKNNYPRIDSPAPYHSRNSQDKIRVAYFSADFYQHATAVLLAEVFEKHDKFKFEIYAFSFGKNSDDDMQKRLAKAFTRFIDVSSMPNQSVAELSRELKIDIAIDLKGYTEGSRPSIFSHRAAPIQINYLGYPGTMSAEFIDYIIADRFIIPESLQKLYSEKILYLPDCYQPNTAREISNQRLSKEDCGLPSNAFVYCCFNNNYKITPQIFDIWMDILNSVPNSVLWLLESNSFASINLKKETLSRNVNPDRLVFAPKLPLASHLVRHQLANLFLDTFPCNAHTTASDALWANLPVLTLTGESFASRVAASLLHTLGLDELICLSTDIYKTRAIELALDPNKLQPINDKLRINKTNSPLFNSSQITLNLESIYLNILK